MSVSTTLAVLTMSAVMLVGQGVNFQPAIYRTGSLPALSITAVGGGEVLLDASVDARGVVTAVTELRATPPFAQLFADAVGGWLFRPARDLDLPAPSHVLVAVLVRPPALTVPSTFGEPPRDVGVPRPDIPMPI